MTTDGTAKALSNLRPWPKGVSGNPGGRKPLPDWLVDGAHELLQIQFQAATQGRIPIAPAGDGDDPEVGDDGAEIPPYRTQVVSAQYRLEAAQRLLDRIRGKAPINVEGTGVEEVGQILGELYAAIQDKDGG